MVLLILVTFAEGADNSLFPSVTKAMETTIGFDVTQLGNLATVQLISQAFAGPVWGILASRNTLSRRTILVIGTFIQGLATALMWMFMDNIPILLMFRAVNGIALASLRPIANSIVGDRFDDTERGQFFGWIMFALQIGIAITSIYATTTSDWVISGTGENTFYGWELAFIVIGGACMALSPAIWLFLKAPPVAVKAEKQGGGVGQEFQSLLKLIQVPTFAVLVLQGCFGLIPWRAFDFRTFFFQTAGLTNGEASTVNACGGFGAAIGSASGGYIGDFLNKRWHLHGRVLAAEIAVYGGIPVAYFTFAAGLPSPNIAFVYYLSLTIGLGLIATWTPGACNNPVLCALASEDERALVIAWQTSLEGAVGALGPIIFTALLSGLGYDPACADDSTADGCDNIGVAGYALFLTSCIPWAVCGALYSCLHCTYPGDLKRMQDKWAAEAAGATTELAGNEIA